MLYLATITFSSLDAKVPAIQRSNFGRELTGKTKVKFQFNNNNKSLAKVVKTKLDMKLHITIFCQRTAVRTMEFAKSKLLLTAEFLL